MGEQIRHRSFQQVFYCWDVELKGVYQRFAEVHIHSCLTEKCIIGALQWKNCVPLGAQVGSLDIGQTQNVNYVNSSYSDT